MDSDYSNFVDDSVFESPEEDSRSLCDEIDALSAELKAIQERVARIQEQATSIEMHSSESDAALGWFESRNCSIWKLPPKLEPRLIPKFVPIEQRPIGPNGVSTRFVSLINLKGGVGKTTISANLSAALAAGNYQITPPGNMRQAKLRVLVVDLDFQGTLSRRCAERERLLAAYQKRETTLRLISVPKPYENASGLAVSFISKNDVWIIPADEDLDDMDFRQLAKLATNPREETRFYYRSWFHCKDIFDKYDIVVFDCPPRLTSSSVCALVASDFVFIPTAPEQFDIPAVSRTLDWVGTTRNNLNEYIRVGGVVLNRTNQITKLSQKELAQRSRFNVMFKDFNNKFLDGCPNRPDPASYILETFIPRRTGTAPINGIEGEPLPGEREGYFKDLATEIYRRIYL